MNCSYKNGCIKDNIKGWSDIIGFGNIQINDIDKNNEFVINNRQSPWNKMEPLQKPYTTPLNSQKAWSPPVSQSMYALLNKECNLCDYNSDECIKHNNTNNKPIINDCCPFQNYTNDRLMCFNNNKKPQQKNYNPKSCF